MKFKNLLVTPALVGTMTLAGCASESARDVHLNLQYLSTRNAPVSTSDVDAQARMAAASSSVSRSLQRLTAIQEAKDPGVRMPSAVTAGGLSRQGSLSWNGPVEPAVARLAAAAGYRLRVLGSRPAIPVIINVDSRNQSLGDILRDITFQAAPAATIVTYPSSRVIELRYRKT